LRCGYHIIAGPEVVLVLPDVWTSGFHRRHERPRCKSRSRLTSEFPLTEHLTYTSRHTPHQHPVSSPALFIPSLSVPNPPNKIYNVVKHNARSPDQSQRSNDREHHRQRARNQLDMLQSAVEIHLGTRSRTPARSRQRNQAQHRRMDAGPALSDRSRTD